MIVLNCLFLSQLLTAKSSTDPQSVWCHGSKCLLQKSLSGSERVNLIVLHLDQWCCVGAEVLWMTHVSHVARGVESGGEGTQHHSQRSQEDVEIYLVIFEILLSKLCQCGNVFWIRMVLIFSWRRLQQFQYLTQIIANDGMSSYTVKDKTVKNNE